mgnify:CR=1 FL=1
MPTTEIRRKDRAISREEAIQILKNGQYGVLATMGEDGYPYGVPISYAYTDDGKLWIHGAKEGHKVNNLQFCPKVSFTVVGKTQVLPDKFSTLYESAVVFGEIHLCEGMDRMKGIMAIVEKYSPDYLSEGEAFAQKAMNAMHIYYIKIEAITGKAKK